MNYRNRFIQGHNIDDDNVDFYTNEVEADLNALHHKKKNKNPNYDPKKDENENDTK